MSIVRTNFLRKFYEEAIEDIEYKSSAFWQNILQGAVDPSPFDPGLSKPSDIKCPLLEISAS
ncbi:hypothetical protein BFJ70_g9741 [Fusarium oxysporum]|nr:hypothetical protein BFJ70_g9741 [Fusarium oxysporum]